jgi:hypothetical protein
VWVGQGGWMSMGVGELAACACGYVHFNTFFSFQPSFP